MYKYVCMYILQKSALESFYRVELATMNALASVSVKDLYIYIIYMNRYVCMYIPQKSAVESLYIVEQACGNALAPFRIQDLYI